MPITAKINVDLIDKTRLFQGKKGRYLDIVLIETPNDKFGNDFMVVQNTSKEERDAGKRGTILGNAKYPVKRETGTPKYDAQQKSASAPAAYASPSRGTQGSGRPSNPEENRATMDEDSIPF